MSLLVDVILLLTIQVSLIVATPDIGEEQERLLAWLPSYANVKNDDASRSPFLSPKRQTESLDNQEAVLSRDTYLPLSESRQLQLEDGGIRWVYYPVAKLNNMAEKRKWQGSQMVVWGKRGQRPGPAADGKRNTAKHKWATAGNMAVWGK